MKLNNNKLPRLFWLAVLTVLLLAVLVPFAVMADTGEPLPGSITGVGTYTFYPTTVVTGSGTAYSTSPYLYRGLDVTKVRDFNSADIFVTVDITPSAILTITPQFSADQSNWTDAKYPYVADTLVSTTEVLTSDGVTTATTTISSSSTPTEQVYQIVLDADESGYVRVPIAGEYMRLKMERSDNVTPTVKVTLRNN